MLRRRARLASFAVLGAALLGGTGCPPPRKPPPDLTLDPGPLLGLVTAEQGRCASVVGEARVAVSSPRGSGTVTQLVQAERPDRVRIDVLDFFGGPVAALASRDGRLQVYDAREKVCLRGAATPENVARLVPVALPVPDLVTLLCGSAPLLSNAPPTGAAPGDGVVELTLAAGGVAQTVGVGPGAALRWSRLRVGGERAPGTYDVTFSDREARGGVAFPAGVKLAAKADGLTVDLTWKSVEPNATPDAGVFVLDCPRGARVVDLD